MSLKDCKILELPIVKDHRGNLTFIENSKHIPFDIKRVYYLYDVPGGAERGGHAHKELQQFITAAMGSFDITLNDGYEQKTFHMNRSYYGLYIPKMIWRELKNFSSGSVCLVLVSDFYKPEDYIRDFNQFRELVRRKNNND